MLSFWYNLNKLQTGTTLDQENNFVNPLLFLKIYLLYLS